MSTLSLLSLPDDVIIHTLFNYIDDTDKLKFQTSVSKVLRKMKFIYTVKFLHTHTTFTVNTSIEESSFDFRKCITMMKFGQKNDFTTSKYSLLKILEISYYSIKLLDLTNCSLLTHLKIDCYKLKSLDLTNCPLLTHLQIENNFDLKSVDLTKCPLLEVLSIKCPEIKSLDLTNCPLLTKLTFRWCENLTSLDLTGLESLTHLKINMCDALTHLDLSGLEESLTHVDIQLSSFVVSSPDW